MQTLSKRLMLEQLTHCTDAQKESIRQRFNTLRAMEDDDLLSYCIFIEGIMAGTESTRQTIKNLHDELESQHSDMLYWRNKYYALGKLKHEQ